MHEKTKLLKIGNLKLDNPFLMAPLAGITDPPTRLIYREMGASLVYSEMVSAKGMYYKDKKTDNLLDIFPSEKPVAFQIFGSTPDIMAFAAEKLESRENAILDVNMGCPVPKVVKNGDGCALMKKPDLVYQIIKKMVENTSKPVTAKIRLGMDDKNINCIEVAQAIEAAGGAAVALHGRTREQFYSGEAQWSYIRKLKENLKIPVIGNGDVTGWESAERMLKETGCDFIMIGRAALGNPWIFKELREQKEYQPTIEEKKSMIKRHLKDLSAYKGEKIAVKEMRKHLGWYTKGIKGSSFFRGKVNQMNKVDEILQAIEEL